MEIRNKQALKLALRNLVYYYGLGNLNRMVTSQPLIDFAKGDIDKLACEELNLHKILEFEKSFKKSDTFKLLNGLKLASDLFIAGLNTYQNDKSLLKEASKKELNEGLQLINNYFKNGHLLRNISSDEMFYLPNNVVLISSKILNNDTLSLFYITLYLRLSGAKFVNIVWHIYNIETDDLLDLGKNPDTQIQQLLVNLKCFDGTIEDLNPQILNPDKLAEKGIAVAQSYENVLTFLSLDDKFNTVNFSKQQLAPYIKNGELQGLMIEDRKLTFKGGAVKCL